MVLSATRVCLRWMRAQRRDNKNEVFGRIGPFDGALLPASVIFERVSERPFDNELIL